MPATSKTQLHIVTLTEYTKLEALIADVSDSDASHKDNSDTSIKDLIGHRAHWIALFLGWYADGQAGKKVFFPAEGYKWNQLKAYNAQLRQSQSTLSWNQARQLLAQNHDRLASFINDHSDHALYGGPMKGANNRWTPGRWAEAAGASHYRSASKYVRQALKARQN